ncbi:acyloxyacyl hydrolase [Ramlibacter sp. G-1-2-2]|uniref:Lipid A deacylase n=1 Tax=Ramlibacter agri TaxID=2728837 RepID=A0A848GYW0_9BURK|nr:acyloxyacyl hydrolase [Ramlibacter agri]NML42482.1 acyloxyacyl hydrolase [Ramlibacter agri]
MMKTRNLAPLAAAAMLLLSTLPAHALDLTPSGVEVIGGPGRQGTAQAGAGLLWDWSWRSQHAFLITGQTELILTQWRYDAVNGGKDSLQQITLLPMFRFVPEEGRSPFFLELGIGATYLTQHFETPHKEFGSQWNFYDTLGGGYRFGTRGEHEVGLRLLHVSNAGLKKPNPGDEFLLLRYAYRF